MWRSGEKATLARMADVAPSQITQYVKRQRQASASTAQRLAAACKTMGLPIKREDWIYTKETNNPYFEGEPDAGQ